MPPKRVLKDDWKIYGLLLRSSDREDLLEISHRVLDPLLSQDRSADLLETLETYLDNDLSPTRTAATPIYVHTNTVKYRLSKLANLMDLDAQTLSGALTIKVALMVRHLDPEGFDAASDLQIDLLNTPALAHPTNEQEFSWPFLHTILRISTLQ